MLLKAMTDHILQLTINTEQIRVYLFNLQEIKIFLLLIFQNKAEMTLNLNQARSNKIFITFNRYKGVIRKDHLH